ncbi:hypothetical protein HD806DRAFT_536307 [Xylariaceae sp. AK1471]|nr:hypothetical protein HD806DRAFT_536307 [Xylariaceae sp. AK1471]
MAHSQRTKRSIYLTRTQELVVRSQNLFFLLFYFLYHLRHQEAFGISKNKKRPSTKYPPHSTFLYSLSDFPNFGPPVTHITSTSLDSDQRVDIVIDGKGGCVIHTNSDTNSSVLVNGVLLPQGRYKTFVRPMDDTRESEQEQGPEESIESEKPLPSILRRVWGCLEQPFRNISEMRRKNVETLDAEAIKAIRWGLYSSCSSRW